MYVLSICNTDSNVRSADRNIVEVKTKSQVIFPFSQITTQNNGNKSFFRRENRESWRLVETATMTPFPSFFLHPNYSMRLGTTMLSTAACATLRGWSDTRTDRRSYRNISVQIALWVRTSLLIFLAFFSVFFWLFFGFFCFFIVFFAFFSISLWLILIFLFWLSVYLIFLKIYVSTRASRFSCSLLTRQLFPMLTLISYSRSSHHFLSLFVSCIVSMARNRISYSSNWLLRHISRVRNR